MSSSTESCVQESLKEIVVYDHDKPPIFHRFQEPLEAPIFGLHGL